MMSTRSLFKGICIPLLLWVAFTPWSAWIDLKMSHLFYQNDTFSSHPFWTTLYSYGFWPAWILVGIAFIGFTFSFSQTYRSWRRPCLFLLLTLAIGSGLVIHAILKEQWGRPRPRQITEFGGQQTFRPYYEPHFGKQSEPSKSFSSGHSSMGFYFFALALLGAYYQRRGLYQIGLGLAWGLGGLLSLTRIAQGGHFFSDTMASALIMWLTAWGLAYFLLAQTGSENERINS